MDVVKGMIKIVIVIILFVQFSCYILQNEIHGKINYKPELFQEPVQTKVTMEPFSQSVGDIEYEITPLYEYELWGLVVSKSNVQNLYNRFLKSGDDPLNILDVCVVWGDGLDNDLYRNFSFSSFMYTCTLEGSPDKLSQLHKLHGHFSNNHLLYANEDIRKEILKTKVGDQIHFTGYLSKYKTSQNMTRDTSTNRTDNGCEVVHVNKYEILSSKNYLIGKVYQYDWYILILLCITWYLLLRIPVIIENRNRDNKPDNHEFLYDDLLPPKRE